MTRETKTERVERVLLLAARSARRRGLRIVFGDFEVRDFGIGPVTGVCALAALGHCAPEIGGTKLRIGPACHDAIEHGFDATGARAARAHHADTFRGSFPLDWYRVGARLRRRLRPVEARG